MNQGTVQSYNCRPSRNLLSITIKSGDTQQPKVNVVPAVPSISVQESNIKNLGLLMFPKINGTAINVHSSDIQNVPELAESIFDMSDSVNFKDNINISDTKRAMRQEKKHQDVEKTQSDNIWIKYASICLSSN